MFVSCNALNHDQCTHGSEASASLLDPASAEADGRSGTSRAASAPGAESRLSRSRIGNGPQGAAW